MRVVGQSSDTSISTVHSQDTRWRLCRIGPNAVPYVVGVVLGLGALDADVGHDEEEEGEALEGDAGPEEHVGQDGRVVLEARPVIPAARRPQDALRVEHFAEVDRCRNESCNGTEKN